MGWDSAEGGYLLPTMDSQELLEEVGLGECQGELFEDLCEAFSVHNWVHIDPYGDLLCDSLRYTWEEFADQVKHRTRYVFFRLQTRDEYDRQGEPHGVLASLAEIIREADLVQEKSEGTIFFRAHQHKQNEHLVGAKRLGAPPAELAKHNRMSPAGISMFYGCGDAHTASEEIYKADGLRPMITVAQFANLRKLRILDLREIPEVPSLFDEGSCHLRMPLIFMHRFAHEISKPIDDAAKPYEYVPTQVVTEYFRHIYREPDGRPIDGIAYRSSKNQGGICYTLFFEQERCADEAHGKDAALLLRSAAEFNRADAPPLSIEAALQGVL